MKALRAIVPACLFIISLVFLFPKDGPLNLVRITKGSPHLLDILCRQNIEVVQELESCYLAKADAEEISALRRLRIPVSVLVRETGPRRYVLVRAAGGETLGLLRTRGNALAVESRTALFWSDAGDPLELVPAGLPCKLVPSASILRSLKEPPSAGAPEAEALEKNETVEKAVDEVSPVNLKYLASSLQAFQTRYASTANCEAAGAFIYDYFQGIGGLSVRYQPFTFRTVYNTKNVIAELPGKNSPSDIVIVCGHYDSTSKTAAQTLAPGADDNASGTAAVLEAARILVKYPLDFSVRFIAFSAEEWGLYGSWAAAAQSADAEEKIIGVINMDMIAYADAMPEDLEIIVNPASSWLADKAVLTAATYVSLPSKKKVDASDVYSDHASYWDQGYPALLAIEDDPLKNPFYHTIGDTVDTLNLIFFENAAKAALALAMELAQPVKAGHPAAPSGVHGYSSFFSSLLNTSKKAYLFWQENAAAAGYNIYRTTVPHMNFEKVNSSPVKGAYCVDSGIRADRAYYYVVTSVDPAGLESNFSSQVEIPVLRGPVSAPSSANLIPLPAFGPQRYRPAGADFR